MADSNDRAQGLLAEARELLDTGRCREAADAFGRLLLLDPEHPEARRGLERARAADAELQRLLEARFDEARRALDSNDREGARRLLEAIVREGGDRDRALAWLDRLDPRGGRLGGAPADRDSPLADATHAPAPRGGWSRRALAGAWTLAFLLTAAGLASSWDRIVRRLVEPPSPRVRLGVPSPTTPAASLGERAVAEARWLIERGDPAGALLALQDVSPDEPAYPLALQLRGRAEAALGRTRRSR